MVHDGIIQGHVAVFLADLDHTGDLMRFRFAHEVCDGGVENQNFQSSNAALSVHALEQALRDNSFQRFGKGRANLVLLISRENVDDTINGLGRALGMERSKNKMPRARGGQS